MQLRKRHLIWLTISFILFNFSLNSYSQESKTEGFKEYHLMKGISNYPKAKQVVIAKKDFGYFDSQFSDGDNKTWGCGGVRIIAGPNTWAQNLNLNNEYHKYYELYRIGSPQTTFFGNEVKEISLITVNNNIVTIGLSIGWSSSPPVVLQNKMSSEFGTCIEGQSYGAQQKWTEKYSYSKGTYYISLGVSKGCIEKGESKEYFTYILISNKSAYDYLKIENNKAGSVDTKDY